MNNHVKLYIHSKCLAEIHRVAKLKAIEWPPSHVKHIELHIDNHKDHADFVDAVLWCCRPKSLTLRSSSPLTDFE